MPTRILVIDDDQVVLKACQRVLTGEGYEVTIENNPRNAFDHVLDAFYEVIICDWHLGQMDGLDVIEILDRRSPKSAIIMISGYPSIPRATEAIRRGAVDFIAKPFTPEEITEAVKKGLRYKRSQLPK